ncbi:tRNA (adenosine(37)-N6)-threonylcarbamoyltransferase complex dimerization subunit type 1 TsaB [Pseudalkalibacillus hwajinpoensis]|uniref:tRNA (Adenosine(37)-N6)-threonylcarbamoyltransferase complex dimerization subunit type 1 TsaB n=1 Tax=Guptibacillus hwajinpoensis TaxID=208199 RepID=A0A4U1M6G6_9BACL|nr:tRNA (adenosine(37)-N6)-threonylcarbamoyltransferase complex dimerization subunit type 1 TsaB [Pseudalkalibacillus hwajinpoensis]TKD66309.1 tRNA (adenosine(37)-N6)-threonylcarbamoyltransferase complex dimerization subunit type 1 TsaB [Pseudalkalibacillus hwajinpoensis]
MKVLAIDSSNYCMGVSVMDGDTIIGEVITNLKKNHSVRLMPAIDQLLEEVGIKPNEIERIVVAEGPGSYTGLRIGISIAKTLAWTLGIPLVGVSSLEVLGQNGRYFPGVTVPFFDARRGQVYMSLFEANGTLVQRRTEDHIVLFEDWLNENKDRYESFLFISNDLAIHKEKIDAIIGDKALFAPVSSLNARPSELARIGSSKEPVEDVHQFTPNYVRMAEAEAKWLASQKK